MARRQNFLVLGKPSPQIWGQVLNYQFSSASFEYSDRAGQALPDEPSRAFTTLLIRLSLRVDLIYNIVYESLL